MRRALVLALALAVPVQALLVARFDWLCDDAFISFRYARNLARGLGLAYNPGVEPPVEGYSNLAWVLAMAVVERLGVDVGLGARALGIACGAALLVWIPVFAARRLGLGTAGTVLAALGFAACPPAAVWSTGGLETMAHALALFAVFACLLGDRERPHGLAAGLWGVLAALLRPDAFLPLGLLLLIGFVQRGRDREARRGVLVAAAVIALGLAGQVAFRLAVHGDWLPNTVRAKGGLTAASLARGLDYLAVFVLTFPATVAIVAAGGWAAWRSRDLRVAASLALVLATAGQSVLVGGDFMAMGRFLVPAAPHVALLLGAAVDRGVRAAHRQGRGGLVDVAAAAGCIALNLLPAWNLHVVPRAVRERFHFRHNTPRYLSEYVQWKLTVQRLERARLLGRALAAHVPPTDSLVLGAIGAVGYDSNLFIFDQNGLVTREVVEAALPDDGRPRSPGHDRHVEPEFFRPWHPTWESALVRRRTKDDAPGWNAQGTVLTVFLDPADGFPENQVLVLVRFV